MLSKIATPAIFIFLFFVSFSCNNPEEVDHYSDCRYGAPEPVFSAALPEIEAHRFSLENDGAGKETIRFRDGIQLTLTQRGCEYIEQEFEFILPESIQRSGTHEWLSLGTALMRRLANMGPEYLSFSSWAKAIDVKAMEMQLGQKKAIQPGYVASIDRVNETDYTIVVITLAQEP